MNKDVTKERLIKLQNEIYDDDIKSKLKKLSKDFFDFEIESQMWIDLMDGNICFNIISSKKNCEIGKRKGYTFYKEVYYKDPNKYQMVKDIFKEMIFNMEKELLTCKEELKS